MITDIILLIIALIALIFATIIDIKTKEVPNWITYSLIISALSLRLITSLATKQFYYITNALIIFVIIYLIAQILYRLQIWGGGDSKLLIALTTTFATKPYFLKTEYPFLLILFVSILVAGAVYAITIAIYLAIKNRKKFIIEFKRIYRKTKLIRIFTAVISILILILIILTKQIPIKVFLFATFILISSYIYIWIAVKAIENVSMYKKILTTKLVEGDWITQNIIKNNKTIYKKTKTGIKKSDIEKLKQHKINYVTIKTGIPFVPPFLAGLILTIIICII